MRSLQLAPHHGCQALATTRTSPHRRASDAQCRVHHPSDVYVGDGLARVSVVQEEHSAACVELAFRTSCKNCFYQIAVLHAQRLLPAHRAHVPHVVEMICVQTLPWLSSRGGVRGGRNQQLHRLCWRCKSRIGAFPHCLYKGVLSVHSSCSRDLARIT